MRLARAAERPYLNFRPAVAVRGGQLLKIRVYIIKKFFQKGGNFLKLGENRTKSHLNSITNGLAAYLEELWVLIREVWHLQLNSSKHAYIAEDLGHK